MITLFPTSAWQEALQCAAPGSSYLLKAGVYRLDAALTLNGLRDVTIRGEEGAVISGSVLSGVHWEQAGENIFRAALPLAAAPDGVAVAGRALRMARYPHFDENGGFFHGSAADCLDFAAQSAHPEDGYFHAMHSHLWGSMHYRITGRDEAGQLTLEGGWQNNRPLGCHEKYRFVENIREALGAEGEFFYDVREQALYICLDEAPPEEVELTVTPYLLHIENCENLSLSGLCLTGSSRTVMDAYEPLVRSDWCIHRGGAVYVERCRGVQISGCDFYDIGSNALFVSGDAREIAVRDCHFHHIGSSCVCFVGRSQALRHPFDRVDGPAPALTDVTGIGPLTDDYPRDCRVEECLMHDFGLAETQTAGVQIAMAARITVRDNSIYRCPRVGVNIGDGTFGGHLIEGNDVFDTVRESSDHGSFNSWGRDRFWRQEMSDDALRALMRRDALETTVLRGNRMRCDHGWDIDLDDGSSNYLIENNLCLGGGIKLREGFERVCRNNLTYGNTLHVHVWYEKSRDMLTGNLVCRPYAPIGMPESWGETVDMNLLHVPGQKTEAPATALSSVSGQDAHSLSVDFDFAAPEAGNFQPRNARAEALFAQRPHYGVWRGRLAPLAERCPLPEVIRAAEEGEQATTFCGLTFKSVTTDGEMSAYATAGHEGVILTAIGEEHPWYRAGLRAPMALFSLNGQPLVNADAFRTMLEFSAPGGQIRMEVCGADQRHRMLALTMVDK